MKKIMFNNRYGLTKAVLSGRKTQIRGICKEQYWAFSDLINANCNQSFMFEKPKYRIGEVVAVAQPYVTVASRTAFWLNADGEPRPEFEAGWNNKLFVRADLMPNRIRITNVRVERLQDISDEDCEKEGILNYSDHKRGYQVFWFFDEDKSIEIGHESPQEAYAILIDRIYGNGTWDRNPYVFVYDFELID